MAHSKLYLFLIFLATWAVVGLGVGLDSLTSVGSMGCLQKLAPCKQYFKQLDKVPETCCNPMKDMLSDKSDDRTCICGAISNPLVLKNLNVTQDEIIDLADACGLKADVSKCDSMQKDIKNAASPSPSKNETAPSPPAPSPSSNAAASCFRESGFAASFIVTLIFSAAFS
ncbi:non-specific lipid transfer protein GPI-anchored 9-like [Argentina anserina]|uniref:non-specific lipid transfer protein GPI-anchored 9-like n=1 Tax=Argentina anserina TaxID=57926 RepID=UPI002176318D|nr:non-specific lipid transfer protein GPI-anchored 9-like [Potentilla anserina]